MRPEDIRKRLFELQDEQYRAFQGKLIPTAPADHMIGVRTPELRKLAKQLVRDGDVEDFLRDLPHRHFDENQLHAFVISELRDYDCCLAEVERFLPYVDNWATCDQMSPKAFGRHHAELLTPIRSWIASGETYTVRFAVKMLMEHYLGDDFDPAYPQMVADIRSDEYYVNMMRAWYVATGLAKRWNEVLPLLVEGHLDRWTHNKAIQKAIESRRITPEQKAYLRTLKRSNTAR